MDKDARISIRQDGIDKIRRLHGGEFSIFDFGNTEAAKTFNQTGVLLNEKDKTLIELLNRVRTLQNPDDEIYF